MEAVSKYEELALRTRDSLCDRAGGMAFEVSSSSCGGSTTGDSWWAMCQNRDVLVFFLRLFTDIFPSEIPSANPVTSCLATPRSGVFEFDRPRNSDIEVFSLKLGRLSVDAIVFDLRGSSMLPCATNVCDGAVSGCNVVEERSMPTIGMVTPGIFTPPTCRASKGAEMVLDLGLVMVMVYTV
jgi:hypothetical protein